MASLRERNVKAEKPVSKTVKQIVGKEKSKKYAVNVLFDGDLEEAIRVRAKERGVGVATYIKVLVAQDLNTKGE